MSRLFLLRHAKASWADPGMRDFDRKLSQEGIEEAAAMGSALRHRGLVPNKIICSSALRARQTFDAMNNGHSDDWITRVDYDEKLYSTDAPGYLEVAAATHFSGDLMLIGHNPMLEDLAIGLGQNGNHEAYSQINMGFATAAVAILHFDGNFSDIQKAKWILDDYIRPRDI
ncbi:MAG: histidine phosphatase family protein [Ahrensia sp.]|nr:histidine phosphatase family protein [Ahrensia sp.]